MQTRDQRYSTDAYERVFALLSSSKTKEECRNYGVMAHKLPILIHKAGLAQALAFVESRGKPAQKWLLDDLARTINGEAASDQAPVQTSGQIAKQEPGEKLFEQARKADLGSYMLLTQQVLDALLWYKRFAQSLLGVDASTETEEDTDNG